MGRKKGASIAETGSLGFYLVPFRAMVSPIIFVLLFRYAFVPTESIPTGLRVFAEYQPITVIVTGSQNGGVTTKGSGSTPRSPQP